MTEKHLREFQARRAKMPIGDLSPELSEKLDRTENDLVERARLERILAEENKQILAQQSSVAKRSAMFLAFKAFELRNAETLKSWIETLANHTKACNNFSSIKSKV